MTKDWLFFFSWKNYINSLVLNIVIDKVYYLYFFFDVTLFRQSYNQRMYKYIGRNIYEKKNWAIYDDVWRIFLYDTPIRLASAIIFAVRKKIYPMIFRDNEGGITRCCKKLPPTLVHMKTTSGFHDQWWHVRIFNANFVFFSFIFFSWYNIFFI